MSDRILIRTLGDNGPGNGSVGFVDGSYRATYRYGGKTYHLSTFGVDEAARTCAQAAVDALRAKLHTAYEEGDAYLSIAIIHEFTAELRAERESEREDEREEYYGWLYQNLRKS